MTQVEPMHLLALSGTLMETGKSFHFSEPHAPLLLSLSAMMEGFMKIPASLAMELTQTGPPMKNRMQGVCKRRRAADVH